MEMLRCGAEASQLRYPVQRFVLLELGAKHKFHLFTCIS
jgi:hypothetical protein